MGRDLVEKTGSEQGLEGQWDDRVEGIFEEGTVRVKAGDTWHLLWGKREPDTWKRPWKAAACLLGAILRSPGGEPGLVARGRDVGGHILHPAPGLALFTCPIRLFSASEGSACVRLIQWALNSGSRLHWGLMLIPHFPHFAH